VDLVGRFLKQGVMVGSERLEGTPQGGVSGSE